MQEGQINESLQQNTPKEHINIPSAKVPPYIKEIANNEEKLYNTKLEEDCQDAQHSLNNTKKLNKIYSQLIHVFFGGWWFYLWLLFLFALFVVSNDDFMQFEIISKNLAFVFKKLFYALGVMFVALLSFPTAKGIRRLFKSIIDILKHKAKNI